MSIPIMEKMNLNMQNPEVAGLDTALNPNVPPAYKKEGRGCVVAFFGKERLTWIDEVRSGFFGIAAAPDTEKQNLAGYKIRCR